MSYDAESGHMYLVDGNERMNNTTVGYSHVEIEGNLTLGSNESNIRELLFVFQPVGMQPTRVADFGVQVTDGDDERTLIRSLLRLRRSYAICHPTEIAVCLSEVPFLRELGMHVLVRNPSNDEE